MTTLNSPMISNLSKTKLNVALIPAILAGEKEIIRHLESICMRLNYPLVKETFKIIGRM